ncbi:hypothetical protein K438DRAFT_1724089 [Mycena galopus ATCC 62051]|nr:hypothetical protein K438DRAFT_1724089 [Mycena galopus ATCC 62051]
MSFAHSQGFQIHGGNFYNVTGGLNIGCPPPLAISGNPSSSYSSGVQKDRGREGMTAPNLIGLLHPPSRARSARDRSSARHHPYSTSGQQQIAWNPPEPAGLPEEWTSQPINDVGSLESENTNNHREAYEAVPPSSGTLISADNPRSSVNSYLVHPPYSSRHTHRERIHRYLTGIESFSNSGSNSRLGSPSFGVQYNSTVTCPDMHEANAFPATGAPENQSFQSLPSWRDFVPTREPGPYTTITGGTFVSNNTHRQGERGIDLLHTAVALAAIYDSAESFPQPKCHPETRTEMLQDLREWALERDPESTIVWLHGPAGAGKSAIMQTLARELQNVGRLGGSFFFKRGHSTRGNGKTLFATVAYQLALGVPWLKAPISNMVEDDPSIIARSIEVQLQKLISEPCCLHNVGETRDPIAILIDGLDECEGQDVQEEILRSLRNSAADYSLPLHFIIASRPEPHICEMFESQFYKGLYRPFNVVQSFDDVRKYLRDEFARIHCEHRNTMTNIPLSWPSPEILEQLVWESSGHFIYASTIIKFVDDKNYRPTERLAIVQQQDIVQSCSAFDPIDQLYMTILCSAPRQAQLVPVLCAIRHFHLHPDTVDRLYQLAPGDTRLLLRGLHSVLELPEDSNEDGPSTIETHHASFLDFLKNERRSQQFYVDGLHHRMDLARAFLKLCVGQYRSLKCVQIYPCHHAILLSLQL